MSVSTESGKTYALEFKNSLLDLNWILLPGSVPGDGSMKILSDSSGTGRERYYRVRAQ